MVLRGIDISSHQSENTTIRWNEVDPNRVQFVVVKATGGTCYKNPFYATQLAEARKLGLLIGHYHYAHESGLCAQPSNPVAEARHFVANSDVRPGEIVALDIEDTEVFGDLEAWAYAWMQEVEQLVGCKPFLYSFPNYMQTRGLTYAPSLYQYPLWYAYYRTPYSDAGAAPVPPQYPRVQMWQWSGGTPVAGFDFPTDENLFYGTREDWLSFGMPGLHVETKPTTPFIHSQGFLHPIVDNFNWGADSAGIIVSREMVVYNDEERRYYRGKWHADHPNDITWERI